MDRFWAKVEKTETCWLWTAATQFGYGIFTRPSGTGPKAVKAHRFSWELVFGPVPAGLFVLHHCDVRNCVRPDHLFLGTIADNNADMRAKGRARYVAPPPRPDYRGEKIPSHRVTEAEVPAIRELYAQGESMRRIGVRFGIAQPTVFKIVHRQTWTHVP